MTSLFVELKRRNVFRVALAYLVLGWLLLQVGDIVFEALGVDAGNRILLALLAIGFIPAVVFAWAFELTPDGIRRERDIDRSRSISSTTGRKLDLVTIGAVLVLMVMLGVDRLLPRDDVPKTVGEPGAVTEESGGQGDAPASIAVLPFADMSEAGDQGYFADGISEEILNVLTRIPGLKVAGRTSSFKFRGVNEDLREIGDQLGVAHILEGSVRKAGDRARITVQLINAVDGFHLWSDTYDRSLKDIFAVQDEISRAVAQRLSLEYGAGDTEVRGTQSELALDLYLRARQALALRSIEGISQAISLFESATIIDPRFDAAYSGLARTLSLVWNYGLEQYDVDRVTERSIAVARMAIDLNPGNAEAWSTLSYLNHLQRWDWSAAEEQNARALELGGNDAEIANFVGDYYRNVSNLEKAFEWEGLAVELNPLLAVNHSDLAHAHRIAGDCETALDFARRSVELDETHGGGWDAIVTAGYCLGQLEVTRTAAERAQPLVGREISLPHQVMVVMLEKDTQAQERILNEMIAAETDGFLTQYHQARLLVHMERFEEAGQALQQAYLKRDPMLVFDSEWILPEDWPHHPAIAAALDQPELRALYALRRENLKNFRRGPR